MPTSKELRNAIVNKAMAKVRDRQSRPDTNPDAVKLLSDDEVAEIEERPFGAMNVVTVERVLLTPAERDALCQTVYALREQFKSMKSKVAWHRDGVGPDVPVLQERYDKLIAERNRLCELADERHDLLSAEKRANDALREQLAQSRAENERLALQLKEWQEEKDKKAGYL